jgi:hypothetical protein
MMDREWLAYLDELAEKAALEIIESEGAEPEYLTYAEIVNDIAVEEELDEEDEEYLIKELERLVTTAEVTVTLFTNDRE